MLRQLNRWGLSLVWPALQQSRVSVPVPSGASVVVASASCSSCSAAVRFPGRLSAVVVDCGWTVAPLQSGGCPGAAGLPVLPPFVGSPWPQSPAGAHPRSYLTFFLEQTCKSLSSFVSQNRVFLCFLFFCLFVFRFSLIRSISPLFSLYFLEISGLKT